MAMCHAFIKESSFLLAPLLQLALDSSKEEMDIQPANEVQHVDEVILKFVWPFATIQFHIIANDSIWWKRSTWLKFRVQLHNKFCSSSFMFHLWKIMIQKCQCIMFNLFLSYHYRINLWSIFKISTLCKSTSMSLSIVGFIIVLYLWPQLAWCT